MIDCAISNNFKIQIIKLFSSPIDLTKKTFIPIRRDLILKPIVFHFISRNFSYTKISLVLNILESHCMEFISLIAAFYRFIISQGVSLVKLAKNKCHRDNFHFLQYILFLLCNIKKPAVFFLWTISSNVPLININYWRYFHLKEPNNTPPYI